MAVILNVEDDSPSRFLKSRILERAGFAVVEAVTAADAVRTALCGRAVRVADGRVIPRITGTAFVTAEATLVLDPDDPFRTGLPR